MKKCLFVLGVLREKDLSGIAELIAPHASQIICTTIPNSRAVPAGEIEKIFMSYNKEIIRKEKPSEAFEEALKQSRGDIPVIVTGSLYLAGEALKYFGWEAQRCCVR